MWSGEEPLKVLANCAYMTCGGVYRSARSPPQALVGRYDDCRRISRRGQRHRNIRRCNPSPQPVTSAGGDYTTTVAAQNEGWHRCGASAAGKVGEPHYTTGILQRLWGATARDAVVPANDNSIAPRGCGEPAAEPGCHETAATASRLWREAGPASHRHRRRQRQLARSCRLRRESGGLYLRAQSGGQVWRPTARRGSAELRLCT